MGPERSFSWPRAHSSQLESMSVSPQSHHSHGGRRLNIAQSHLSSCCILLKDGLAFDSTYLGWNSDSVSTCCVVMVGYSTSLCLCFPMYEMGIM